MPGYRGGHILRIKVKNFMTYDEMELFPKHGLNLIIGLNGSGKSTIMCAICLGLAGKPQYTGRSAQLSEFIKYGCDKATIEIELHDPDSEKQNVVITRIIQADKSTWLLNKALVSHHEVQSTVKKFNIDVGNLCQFLPQEKVTEFSKMDKKQRLENMLQAIGEPQLYSLFKELKLMKGESVKIEEKIKRQHAHKEAECQINSRLKIDVDKHEEKMRMKETLKSLKQHKLKLEYQEIREESIKLKEDRKPIRQEAENLSILMHQIREKINEISEAHENAVKKIEPMTYRLRDLQNSMARKANDLEINHAQADHAKIHYLNKLEEKRNQKARLIELERQIKALNEIHKNNLKLKPKLEEEDRNIKEQLEKIKTRINELGPQHTYEILDRGKLENGMKGTKAEIEKMKNEENKKLELLQQRFKDVYQGVLWLRENQQRFRAPVHPPMLLVLKVDDDENRKYVENVVGKRDLIAFLCEDKEDNKLLTKILRLEKNLQVNIVMAPDNPIQSYLSPQLTPEMRKLGIQCFLKDIIDAPDAVMRFLCHCCHIHMIPLCLATAEQNMSDILKYFRVFFTPDAKFQSKVSKYSKNPSIKRDPVRSNNLLPSSKDHSDKLDMLQAKYENEQNAMKVLVQRIQGIQKELKDLERQENSLREEKRQLQLKFQDIYNTEKQLKVKNQSYEKKRVEMIDEAAEKEKVVRKIQQKNENQIKICAELEKDLKDFISWKTERLKCNLLARFLLKCKTNQLKLLDEKTKEYNEIQARLVELNRKISEIKDKGTAMYEEITKHLTEEAMAMFHNLSCKDKEEIEQEIRQIEAKLELDCEENEAVIGEYKERKARIEYTEKEIENLELQLKRLQTRMLAKKKEWLPALKKHIDTINKRFSKYYHQLNCAGEISLDTCNDTDDFPKYGLQITLKYRDNEPFMELSNTHHSGGECSVAAIIFILSLQELTEVPFRCIDEINQGMDSQNERNIYNLIADSAKNGSCSQYFLLTPKLLMDLEMIENRDVAVHVIFNSLFLDMKLDVEKHLKLAG